MSTWDEVHFSSLSLRWDKNTALIWMNFKRYARKLQIVIHLKDNR